MPAFRSSLACLSLLALDAFFAIDPVLAPAATRWLLPLRQPYAHVLTPATHPTGHGGRQWGILSAVTSVLAGEPASC